MNLAALAGLRWPQGLRRWAALLGVLCLLAWHPAQAHLMVAQRGTLNIVGTGGFVVMALPVASLRGVDDDGDGMLSAVELQQHAGAIEQQVQQGLQLIDAGGTPLPLQALMLNLSPDDNASAGPANSLVVLGRFALPGTTPESLQGLKLGFTLFGNSADTQQQSITVTQGKNKTQKMVLAPGRDMAAVFPSAASVLWDNARLGAEHVTGGLDHLLFLLVVLATGWSWRQTVLALTAFTAGHAITLAASALGVVAVPASVVEPAIAATIVGIALFDRWSSARPNPLAPGWRLGLVFGCALIHGLGLSTALSIEGLDTGSRLLSLAGFNLGIEAAQLGIAAVAGVLLMAVNRSAGAIGLAWTKRLASVSAMAVGSVWLAQRVLVAVS